MFYFKKHSKKNTFSLKIPENVNPAGLNACKNYKKAHSGRCHPISGDEHSQIVGKRRVHEATL